MKLPSRALRRKSRGQAMVEFALILPIILLLVLLALDLGRVYFGWVGLQNAARIGANYAAIHPDAWSLPDTPLKQLARAQYAQQIAQDSAALNCSPRPTIANVPLPAFVNVVGTLNAREMGDHASVTLHCTFQLLTPVVSSFVGGVPIAANAVFTIRAGTVAAIPTPAPTPVPTATPAPTATPTATPSPCLAPLAAFSGAPTSGTHPMPVQFTDASIAQGCPILTWDWDFGDGSAHSSLKNPLHNYTAKGNFSVTLVVTSAAGASSHGVNAYIKVK